MLILTRKRQESIVLSGMDGSSLRITVLEIRGGRVRLGFDGDSDIAVHREEYLKAVPVGGRRPNAVSSNDVPAGDRPPHEDGYQ